MSLYTIHIDPELDTQVSNDALHAALEIEFDILFSNRAFAQGEDTPGGELNAVDYVCYPAESEEGDDQPRTITLWVGLHPDVGCVNVDAGRERLETEGWQVVDWGAV